MAHTDLEVVNPGDLKEGSGTPGISRDVAFDTENNVVVEATVGGGVQTGWHHHCGRHVYAYLQEGGPAVIEYGQAGEQQVTVEEGGFLHVAPRTVHRDLNPTADPQRVIISFVGSGPLVENVDGPAMP
jgi:uncharacterized RmlC-like cupin family protein